MKQVGNITDNSVMNPTQSPFRLPPELLVEILNYLENQQSCLYSASLVCKQWFYCAAPILYCHPQINDTYLWAIFILTLTREKMSFFYGDLVRSVDLSSGKYIEMMRNPELYRPLSDDPQTTNNENNIATNTRVNNLHPLNRLNIHLMPRNDHTNPYINNSGDVTNSNSSNNPWKGLPFITVSTSSLFQLSHSCKNITKLNLSYTILFKDSLVAETGEYVSTLQHHANQPGLTHIQIPIEAAIQNIGKECQHLEEVKVQRCEWITAHVIWMFVYYCTFLRRLDARNSTKCTIKRLITRVLEATDAGGGHENEHISNVSNDSASENDSAPSSSAPSITGDRVFHTISEEGDDDNDIAEQYVFDDDTNLFGPLTPGIGRTRDYNTNQVVDTEQNLRGTFWFVPLPSDDEIDVYPYERRPPSPTHISLNIPIISMNDLSWLQEY
ncbi:hypothetical protein K501DRAFT_338063 [Backusella circina FSU 941]|nr:hypothetical protein K501DRAFT_338063 [Backusella circina FSU 941]